MSLRRIGVFLVVLQTLLPPPALAQSSGEVLFNGFILGTCAVIVLTPGTLGLDGDGDQLSSDNAGGLPGTANVVTTSIGYQVAVDTPPAFTLAPSGGDVDVSYSVNYSGSGATALTGIVGGILSLLGVGATLLEIDATADKNAGTFPAGEYLLPVTVRCVAL